MFMINVWSDVAGHIFLRYRGTDDEAARLAEMVNGKAFEYFGGELYPL